MTTEQREAGNVAREIARYRQSVSTEQEYMRRDEWLVAKNRKFHAVRGEELEGQGGMFEPYEEAPVSLLDERITADGDHLDALDLSLARNVDPIHHDPLILPCPTEPRGSSYCDGVVHHRRAKFPLNGWRWAVFEQCPYGRELAEIRAKHSGRKAGAA